MPKLSYNEKAGGDIPDKKTGSAHTGLENLPMGELWSRAEMLKIPGYRELNKQKLIAELHRRGE